MKKIIYITFCISFLTLSGCLQRADLPDTTNNSNTTGEGEASNIDETAE